MLKNKKLTIHVNKDLSYLTNERVPTKAVNYVTTRNLRIETKCQNWVNMSKRVCNVIFIEILNIRLQYILTYSAYL